MIKKTNFYEKNNEIITQVEFKVGFDSRLLYIL